MKRLNIDRKKLISIITLLALFFMAFIYRSYNAKGEESEQLYKHYIIDVFDTKIDLLGYAKNQKQWDGYVKIFDTEFRRYHELYDTFRNYEGINNIKTINDNAGVKPVKVDKAIIDLIEEGIDLYEKGHRKNNIAMGAVFKQWHAMREKYMEITAENPKAETEIPKMEDLKAALEYSHIEDIVIDKENSTVFLKKKGMLLDVGAVAKGYATELVAKKMKESGLKESIISAGGNIKIIGAPMKNDKKSWAVGIQNPFFAEDKSNILDILYLKSGSVVSSGDYERFYMYKGKRMHHILDPDTLMPGENFSQVTIITEDSGKADFYSTAVYLMTYEEGMEFAKKEGIDVIWVFKDKSIKTTDNIKKYMKSLGATPPEQ